MMSEPTLEGFGGNFESDGPVPMDMSTAKEAAEGADGGNCYGIYVCLWCVCSTDLIVP